MRYTYHILTAGAGGLLAGLQLGHGDGNRLLASQGAHGMIFAIAHMLPDVDLLSRKVSGQAYLKTHRGVTHSLLFSVVVAALLAAPMFGFGDGIGPFKTGMLAAGLGAAMHLLLDVFTPYPMALLWPLKKRFCVPLLYFRDPAIGLFIAFSMLFYGKPTTGAAFSGIMIGLWLVLRGCFLLYAKKRFPFFQRHLGREKVQDVAFVPDPFMPWRWKVAIRTDDAFHTWNLDLQQGMAIDRERFDRREVGTARRARAHELVHALDAYTPFFYLSEMKGTGNRTIVRGKDMRFHFYGDENPFRIEFTYDNNNLVEGKMLF